MMIRVRKKDIVFYFLVKVNKTPVTIIMVSQKVNW